MPSTSNVLPRVLAMFAVTVASGCFDPSEPLAVDDPADASESGAGGDGGSMTTHEPGTSGDEPSDPSAGDPDAATTADPDPTATTSEDPSGDPDEGGSSDDAASSESGESGEGSTGDPVDPDTAIVLFDGGVEILGDWGPRTHADAHCDTHPSKPEGLRAVAFASFDAGHEIRDLPGLEGFGTDRPIVGPDGVLARDWADLLDGTVENSLVAAGVLPAGAFWLSGSHPNGGLDDFGACSAFTNTEQNANAGSGEATNDDWIFHHGGGCWQSTTNFHRLCIAFE